MASTSGPPSASLALYALRSGPKPGAGERKRLAHATGNFFSGTPFEEARRILGKPVQRTQQLHPEVLGLARLPISISIGKLEWFTASTPKAVVRPAWRKAKDVGTFHAQAVAGRGRFLLETLLIQRAEPLPRPSLQKDLPASPCHLGAIHDPPPSLRDPLITL